MSEREPSSDRQPAASVYSDRRAYVRIAPSDLTATCSCPGRTREAGWPGRVKDVSQGGVGLFLRHRFRPGTALTIELREHTGRVVGTVRARVAHATAVLLDGTHCWLLGCSFERPLSDEEFEALA